MIVVKTPKGMETAVRASATVALMGKFANLKVGTKEAANLLLKESRKIVPIDKKVLYKSSRVVTRGRGRATFEAAVEYRTEYALRQHEELNWKHAPGKSAKYLEKPARRFRSQMAAIIRKRVASK
jgi:hypothetical protein